MECKDKKDMRKIIVNGKVFIFEQIGNPQKNESVRYVTTTTSLTPDKTELNRKNENKSLCLTISTGGGIEIDTNKVNDNYRCSPIQLNENKSKNIHIEFQQLVINNEETRPNETAKPKENKVRRTPNDHVGFLESQNKKRALHRNTPPLQWDQKLAEEAKQWAEKLIRENGGKIMHCSTRGDNIGENLFIGMSKEKHEEVGMADKVIDKWYSEIKDFDYRKPQYTSLSGHFSQLVWASSTHVGVGYAQAKIGQFHTLIAVARYKPAGNIVMKNEFEKNVLPPK